MPAFGSLEIEKSRRERVATNNLTIVRKFIYQGKISRLFPLPGNAVILGAPAGGRPCRSSYFEER
jgi:hypothetical protein